MKKRILSIVLFVAMLFSMFSLPGMEASAISSAVEYFDCNVKIDIIPSLHIPLYWNPGDASACDILDTKETKTSTKGARLSDGSVWYQVNFTQNGTAVKGWIRAGCAGAYFRTPVVTDYIDTTVQLKLTPASAKKNIQLFWNPGDTRAGDILDEDQTKTSIGSAVLSDGSVWHRVNFLQNGNTLRAWLKVDPENVEVTTKTVMRYFNCYVQVVLTASDSVKKVQLFWNPGDTRACDVLDAGQTKTSYRCAILSDGTVWYQVDFTQNGTPVKGWLKAKDPGVCALINGPDTALSVSPSSVTLNTAESKTLTVTLSGSLASDMQLSNPVFDSDLFDFEWISTAVVNNQAQAKLTGKKAGSGTISFSVARISGSEVWATKSVGVTVNAPAAQSYTVTYNANGGSGAPSAQTVTVGSRCTIPSAKPTRSGYTFQGWATSLSDATAAYQPGDSITINGNTTLYAVWRVEKYTLTYNLNGGSGDFPAQTVNAGSKCTISSTVPTRSGYSFLGWTPSAFDASIIYQPGASFVPNGNVILYAVWKIDTYTLTYDANGGSGAPAPHTISGEKGTISSMVLTREKYTFLGWSTSSSAAFAMYQPGDTIIINADTTLYAVWQEDKEDVFRLSYYYYAGSPSNGYEEGTSDELPCRFVVRSAEDTREGYTFKGWSWNKNSTIPEYYPGDIVEVEEDRTLYAVWEADKTLDFTDVTIGAYYYDAVEWAVQREITSGTSKTTFSPDASCTRAQAVTFLWRAAGSPEPASSATFSDVQAGSYYDKAVRWAVEQGITSGTGKGKFSPDNKCSRAQIVTFLYRAAGSPSTGGNSFSDVPSSAYYAKAVSWAVGKKITSGTGGGKFSPDNDCTRGQIVTFLYRNLG